MQRNRITGNNSSAPWQESVVRDRGGEGSSSARSRAFPSPSLSSHSFPSRPPAARPPVARPSASNPSISRQPASHPFASPLPPSNPFASRLPAANSIASRLRASRPLSAPGDGSSSGSSSSESTVFFSASSTSVDGIFGEILPEDEVLPNSEVQYYPPGYNPRMRGDDDFTPSVGIINEHEEYWGKDSW